MKIAVITCYFDPDYVRARTLRAALRTLPGVKVIVVKNTHKGILRYPEILWKIHQVKYDKPDVYLLTFRGQEILPAVLVMTHGKPLWFDEFIVPIAYATGEKHHKSIAIRIKHFLARTSEPLYKRWLRHCAVVLADTKAHAELSARVSHMNLSKYLPVPVGADEELFKPGHASPDKEGKFTIFYYSSGMQPLHGIPVVLEAAKRLGSDDSIEFIIVGGKQPMQDAVELACYEGANIRYESWIPFNDLAQAIHDAALTLGGPFGDTAQAHHVITGKTYQFLACGAPVVVGSGEATDEYFIDKQNALVVPQGDSDALAKAIKWAQTHPAELQDIAAAGRKLYEKEFSTEAIARILQPLVASL